MRKKAMSSRILLVLVLLTGSVLYPSIFARGHCDTLGGPVVKDGRLALEKGDLKLALKWIKASYEAELRTAFDRAVAVRAKGADARELADQYFLETLVRLHRAGEGAPFTGLKAEPLELIVDLSDKALAEGSDKGLIKALSGHLAKTLEEKFKKAALAMKDKDASVEAGRTFVETYVIFMHYVEAVHAAISGEIQEHH